MQSTTCLIGEIAVDCILFNITVTDTEIVVYDDSHKLRFTGSINPELRDKLCHSINHKTATLFINSDTYTSLYLSSIYKKDDLFEVYKFEMYPVGNPLDLLFALYEETEGSEYYAKMIKDAYAKLKQENKQIAAYRDHWKEKYDHLKCLGLETTFELNDVNVQLTSIEDALIILQRENAAYKTEISNLRKEKKELIQENSNLQKRSADLRSHNKKLVRNLNDGW